MQKISCQVDKIEPLTEVVSRVVLTPETPLKFTAGQYLQVVMGDTDKRPFSIANAPREDGSIELHIGAEPGNQYAGQVLEKMQADGKIAVEGGLGQAFLNDECTGPIILLAGGTGFSYTLSILEQLLAAPLKAPVHLYWGTRTFEDMYAFEQLTTLAKQHQLFSFTPVIELPAVSWQGATGWVHQVVMKEHADLSQYTVFVAGRFDMAKTVRTDFCQQGLDQSKLFGDAYAFI